MGATLEFHLLASGYGSVEGPTAAAHGALYFSDPIKGGVYERTPDGAIAVVVPKRRGVGGLCLHGGGGIVVSGRDLTHVRGGESRTLFGRDDFQAAGLPADASFNDISADDRGRILAGAVWGGSFDENVKGALVLCDAPGRARILYDGVRGCNGIALDGRRNRLYQCATYAREIIVSDPSADYKIVDRLSTRDIPGHPDGLALDQDGFLWIACYQGGSVARLAPDGRLQDLIPVPAHDVTSLCFAGADKPGLIVVSADNKTDPRLGGCVFQADVAARGAPVYEAAL